MRLSLWASAFTSAVLTTVFALPLLAQPAPKITSFTIMGRGKNRIELRCKDMKYLSRCIDGAQGLSSKGKSQLKAAMPKLQAQMNEALAKAEDRSSECFAMDVYKFPRSYPEKNAAAKPEISDCTSASTAKEKSVVLQAAAPVKTKQH